MNLEDSKTLEDYREAAHFWQQQWAIQDKINEILLSRLTEVQNENQRLLRGTDSEIEEAIRRFRGSSLCGGIAIPCDTGKSTAYIQSYPRRWAKWFSRISRIFKVETKSKN